MTGRLSSWRTGTLGSGMMVQYRSRSHSRVADTTELPCWWLSDSGSGTWVAEGRDTRHWPSMATMLGRQVLRR